jgi:hypothetical protein
MTLFGSYASPRSLSSVGRSVLRLARLFGLPALAGYRRIKDVTLIRPTDFICCHFLWQVRFNSLVNLFGSWIGPHWSPPYLAKGPMGSS